ncbi:hypothetical protein LB411_31295, partial [Klebsiella pneumoniae]|nr:hypothetical protein [Klebsiella pneumoniae]MCD5904190.1 hypothetical protein [Klebsiella pneumoniae]
MESKKSLIFWLKSTKIKILLNRNKHTRRYIYQLTSRAKRNQKKQHYQHINIIDFNMSLHCFGTAPYQNKNWRCADR